jgi:outer membrane protein
VLSTCCRLFGHWLQREPVKAAAGCAVVACVGFAAGRALAQVPPAAPLAVSLSDALQRAARTSDERALARYSLDSAKAQQTLARSDYYPQVSLSASYERTLASEFDQVFSAPATDERAATAGTDGLDFQALPFGRQNVYRAGASVTQNVYAGGRTRAATRAARASRSQAEIGLESADAQTALATVEAYYDALLSDRFLAISTQTLQRAQATLEQVQLARHEGQESEYDLLRARVALENERPNLVSRQMQQKLAYLRLSQRLGLPPERQLSLTSKLDEPAPLPAPASAARALDPEARAPVRQAELALRTSQANYDAAHAGDYPTLSLQMSYGRVNYPGNPWPTVDDWRTNWTVGAYVSWSLFEGFRTRAQVIGAEAEVGRAQTRLSQTRKAARYDTQLALEQLDAALAVYEASAGTAEQAHRAYAIAEVRYREGVSTQLELSDARLSLAQAEINRAQATRDLEVARVRRALLPSLPLSTGTPLESALAPASAVIQGATATPLAGAGVTGGAATGAAAATAPAAPAGSTSARGF